MHRKLRVEKNFSITFISEPQDDNCRGKMRPLPYVAVFTVLLGLLLVVGAAVASAQSNPEQTFLGGGGMIRGNVYGFNMWDELVPIEWATVTAANSRYSFVAYTGGGGTYEMFVPMGVYNVTVAPPGYKAYSISVTVGDGSSSSINFYLEQSGVPVPEFQPAAFSIVLFVALASVLLAKRTTTRRHRHSK